MPESATTPSAPRPLGPSAPITSAQRRALFASANQRGLSLDDLRALTPQRSISKLSSREAHDLLQRLNDDGPRSSTSPHGPRSSASPRRPRRPSNVIALISSDQLALIRKLRISMGWNQHQLGDHMRTRHYPSDPSRTMDEMQTSRDAQAVIEHLKKILRRTLAAAAKMPEDTPRSIPQWMKTTPPFPRLLALLNRRREELSELTGLGVISTHPDNFDCCAGVACAIERLESQISNLKSKEPAQ